MNDPGEWLKCLFAHVVVLVRGQSAAFFTNYPEVIVISSDCEKEKKASGAREYLGGHQSKLLIDSGV
jgi:hypothetical protein